MLNNTRDIKAAMSRHAYLLRDRHDDLAFLGDMDELVELKYGSATTVGEAITMQLSTKGMTLSQLCRINLGWITRRSNESMFQYYRSDGSTSHQLRIGTN
jgi:hypothetical protein